MSKIKWHTRAIYLVVALVMTLGLTLVPAAPPAVEADPAVAEVVLVQRGVGEACWASCNKYAGDWSVRLTIPLGATWADAARVQIPYDGLLSTLTNTNIEYWYSTGVGQNSFVRLDIDADGNGIRDHVLISQQQDSAVYDGTWTETIQTDLWHHYTIDEATQAATLVDQAPLATQITAIGTPATTMVTYLWVMLGPTNVPQTIDGPMYIDDITIAGTKYELEPELPITLGPTEYNVKTATETFVVADQQDNPICLDLVWVDEWFVTKGCGPGEVTVTDGGRSAAETDPDAASSGDKFITVRMVTTGDCIVTGIVNIDFNCDGDFEDEGEGPFQLSGEKKWGEIYCTELVKARIGTSDDYTVTETVTALFWWHECTDKVQHVADDAKVDWWLMKIGGQAAIEALEAELGDDPCDADGGCGAYPPGWLFQYDLDDSGTIDLDEKFGSPRAALLAIYAQYKLSDTEKLTNYIDTVVSTTHTSTSSNELGKTAVIVHTAAPTSVILATLTDYPIDKAGQNTVCVQHEKWVVIPPPVIEKLPNILWAGEKDVIEWRLPEGSDENTVVVFYLEDPSVGTFESLVSSINTPPYPGFAIRDTAWGLVEPETCGDDYYVARTVLHSDKQGKANVIAVLLDAADTIVSQQGFLVYFLAFEDVELKNIEEDPTNDEAWELEGDELSDLYLDHSSKLRLRVKGWFEDPVMTSTRPEKPQDLDRDGTTDIILPAGRWVLPDDYPTLAFGKLLWDMMDTPVDDIVSLLDSNSDEVETLGAYGEEACFEYVLADTTLTDAAAKAAYLEALVACYPVIGPFSKLQAVNEDGTAWDLCDITWVGRVPTMLPEVPADGRPVDALKVGGILPILTFDCRTTVVPDGSITEEDANMPPAEILFAITAGSGLLAQVNKADLYQIPETCDTDTGVVYTNPYYWQEIPANPIIPPMYGSGLAGYEWDSWDTDVTIDGPYRFWDALNVWTSDELILMNILDLSAVPTTALKAYTDNHGEAWVEFTQKCFEFSTIQAVATYPYLIGDHLPLVSNPVTKLSEDFKDIKVAWERIDDMTDMLYIFVCDYDGDPAVCEEVEWTVDSPSGTIEALYEGDEGTSCVNECFDPDFTCIRDIAADSESATGCTREMTAAEVATFTDAEITLPLDRFHREIVSSGELLFDPTALVPELPADYAIAGIRVISSLGDDVDILIKIHDCWDSVETIMPEDQILYFGNVVPGEDILDYYRGLDGIVSTSELLTAITDWADGTIPSGFTEALTTTELLTLITEWAS